MQTASEILLKKILSKNIITKDQLEEIKRIREATQKPLEIILVDNGFVNSLQLQQCKRKKQTVVLAKSKEANDKPSSQKKISKNNNFSYKYAAFEKIFIQKKLEQENENPTKERSNELKTKQLDLSQIESSQEETQHIKFTSSFSVKPNMIFEKYRFIDKIGEGNFGEVFLVFDIEWNKTLALKVLKTHYLKDKISIKRFEREAEALAQLSHPGVVRVYKFGVYNSISYYTMDYIDGYSLDDYLVKEKRISCRRATRIMIDVANIISHAHDNEIIHRDIKPENIMFNKKGQLYLTDFGLAKGLKAKNKLSKTGVVIGTPAYMSPEQAQGKKSILDRQSDIYSLGATLYESITGKVPFSGKSTSELIYNIINKKVISPRSIIPSIAPDLEKICLKCLEKKKKNRYVNAKALQKDLELFLEGKKIESRKSNSLRWAISMFICVICCYLLFTKNSVEKLSSTKINRTVDATKIEAKVDTRGMKGLFKQFWQDFNKSRGNELLQFIILSAVQRKFPQKARNKYHKNFTFPSSLASCSYFKRKYYAAFHEKITWIEAEKKCANMGGKLIVLNTKERQEFAQNFIKKLIFMNCQCWNKCWIGLRKNKEKWQWVNHSPFHYKNWAIGEPNNNLGKENFVEILRGSSWNDNTSEDVANFICEWEINN